MKSLRTTRLRVVPAALLLTFVTACGESPDSGTKSLDNNDTSSSTNTTASTVQNATSSPASSATSNTSGTSAATNTTSTGSTSSTQVTTGTGPDANEPTDTPNESDAGTASSTSSDQTSTPGLTSADDDSDDDDSDDDDSDDDDSDDDESDTSSDDSSSGNTNTSSGDSSPSSGDEPDGDVTMGQGGVVNATIVVQSGEIFDGGGKTFTAGSALGDGSQDEDQQPVFRLEDGAQLRNVTLGAPAADGIHCYGDVTLNNINWLDIGEDALTIKESGTVVIDGGSAQNGEDKVFQINAESTFIVRNFTARNAGKFIRQNGDTTFRVDVVIEDCDISQMDECIFRTDSSTSTVTMRNTRYSDLGDGLFVGVNESNITLENNEEY